MQTLETRDKLQWHKGREKEDLARLAREKEEREWWQEEQRASIEGAAILQAAEVCLSARLPGCVSACLPACLSVPFGLVGSWAKLA